MNIPDEQWQQWQRSLQLEVKERRFHHSLSVAEEAVRLARHWGLDEEKARMAGLLHDVARDLPYNMLHMFAREYGIHEGREEFANPLILHAPVGAARLRDNWHIEDEDVLTAISLHTVASPGMDTFSQVLYLADIIEPNRKKWPDLARLRELCYEDLRLAMLAALESNFRYLELCGVFIHPRALAAHEFFAQQVNGQE